MTALLKQDDITLETIIANTNHTYSPRTVQRAQTRQNASQASKSVTELLRNEEFFS